MDPKQSNSNDSNYEGETSDESSNIDLVVPATMRSSCWKYFGFPAGKNRDILTKEKVVCVVCLEMFKYSKNTTNMMMHLFHKHPEKYVEFQSESESKRKKKIRNQVIKIKQPAMGQHRKV